MRTVPTASLCLALACCGGGSSGGTPAGQEPSWLAERAGELEPAAYALAVAAATRPVNPLWPFSVEADATCGGDRFHARYRVVEDALELEVTAADALSTAPVELRLGGKVAVRDVTRWETVNSLKGDAPGHAPFLIEHASTFLPSGTSVPVQLTVAWAHRASWGFVWGKRRTIKGVTLRIQRPDDATLARFTAEPTEATHLTAEETVLGEDGRGLGNLVREARRWTSPTARRIVETHARLRADFERRHAAFTEEFRTDGPKAAGILAIGGAACE